jgi:2-beta-glucuronyltransferase
MEGRAVSQRIVLVTGHYYESKRRAGFHFLADAFQRAGNEVLFFTSALSWLSRLRGDARFAYPVMHERGRIKRVRSGIESYVWFTPWHPAHLRSAVLNRAAAPLYRRYSSLPLGAAEPAVRAADVFVFECSVPLMLVERFRRLRPSARFVYRVSDDQRLLHNHPIILEIEAKVAPTFDLISAPSEFLHDRFRHLPQAVLQRHGLQKEVFDAIAPNPYPQPEAVNCIFVGNAHLDVDFLERASAEFPAWWFHIIGPFSSLPRRPNILGYGELPFLRTIPYLQHASIGLTALTYRFGAESFTDSLKTLQYTYCGLPVVAPEFLRMSRRNAFYYGPGDSGSIRDALLAARGFDRAAIGRDDIPSWDDLAAAMLDVDGEDRA